MVAENTSRGIVVIGELNVDAVATGLTKAPLLGAEVIATDVRLTLGSASAIFACGAAKLGNRVSFVGRVGDDAFADICIGALGEAGIAIDRVERVHGERTGVTFALSTRRDRALVTYLGAIASFRIEDVDLTALDEGRHLHMTSYFLQSGLRPSFPTIMREAKQRGLTTSFDPNSDPRQSWGRGIRRVLRETDVLFVNDREAMELTGARSAAVAMRSLADEVGCVVVKRGAKGSLAQFGGRAHSATGFLVDAVDTTGAGDSFAAGFVSAWIAGRDVDTCLRHGNACGALSTRSPGGTAGQPDAAELRRFLRRHPQGTPPNGRGGTRVRRSEA